MLENHVGSIAALQITFRKAKEQLFHVLWPENITHHEITNIRWYEESISITYKDRYTDVKGLYNDQYSFVSL